MLVFVRGFELCFSSHGAPTHSILIKFVIIAHLLDEPPHDEPIPDRQIEQQQKRVYPEPGRVGIEV